MSEVCDAQVAALSGARRTTGESWQGQAAYQADLALAAQRVRLTSAGEQMRAMGTLLAQAAEELSRVRGTVARILAEAHASGCTVGADGGVTGTSSAPGLAARLAAALDEADHIDSRFAGALSQVAAPARDGTALDGPVAHSQLDAATSLVAATMPGPGSSPAQVRDWWQRLGPDEQRMLVTDQPQLIGGLDGIPSSVRDRANRVLLGRLVDGTEDQTRRDGFLAIQQRLRKQQGLVPPALLLAIGDQGQGRAVLSFGDPDRSANVAVYVPGVGTTPAAVAGKDGDRALAIHDAAALAGARGSTASVVWLGYDPPAAFLDAAGSGRAAAGAAPYCRFLEGLRAVHQGSAAAHLTAVGHSYGSLVVGKAAQRPGGLPVDDLVLLGSPGTGASRAEQLGVPPGHVWAASAPHDPVSRRLPAPEQDLLLLGAGVAEPATLIPARIWAAHEQRTWFGTDPASSVFGARLLPSSDGPDGSPHSFYLDRRSPTLAAVGRVVGSNGG